jgi:hypothetical protein
MTVTRIGAQVTSIRADVSSVRPNVAAVLTQIPAFAAINAPALGHCDICGEANGSGQ